ncbi:LPXTG cell wall anchor domain-containing protein [Kitasatospora sp. NPDC001664]
MPTPTPSPAPGSGELPATGAQVTGVLGAAGALTVAGSLLLLLRRGRRSRRH